MDDLPQGLWVKKGGKKVCFFGMSFSDVLFFRSETLLMYLTDPDIPVTSSTIPMAAKLDDVCTSHAMMAEIMAEIDRKLPFPPLTCRTVSNFHYSLYSTL